MEKCIVTGANRGIGLALCKQLRDRGSRVIAVCRAPGPALQELGVDIVSGVDVSSDASVASLAERLHEQSVDLLINNAGILREDSLSQLSLNTVSEQFAVNAVGPLRVTTALLRKLKRGSKVALITSRMGSIADNSSGGYYGYRMSKAALNAAGVSLAHDLRPWGISVAILHPGFVRTDMTGNSGNVDTTESASGLLERIDELTLKTSGTFWHANGERLSW